MRSSAGSDRTYGRQDEILVGLSFDEKVTVDTEDGVPWIELTVGAVKERARYERGAGSRELVFRHRVVSAEPADIAAFFLGNTTRHGIHGGDDTDGVSVEAGRIGGGLITDSSGHLVDLDHPALAPQSSHKVDGTRPVLDRLPVAEGDTLELVFSEALVEVAAVPTSAFIVRVDGAARTVSDVSLSGGTVTLTLASALSAGDSASVEYYYDTGYLADMQGNLAYPVWPTAVINATPATTVSDPQGPDIFSLTLTSDPGSDGVYAGGDTIEVTATFSDNVTVDTIDGTPSLNLMVGKAVRTAAYMGGSGSASSTFSYTVAQGYPPRAANFDEFHTDRRFRTDRTTGGDEDVDGVSIEVGRIALNGATIRNATDNDADLEHEGLAPQSNHKVDGVVPTVDGRPVGNGTTLTFSYVEALDASSAPDAAEIVVVGRGSRTWAVSNVSLSGSTITLTLESPLGHDEQAWLRYEPGSTPVRDLAGSPGKRLYDIFVENETPAPPPPVIDPLAASVDSITIASDPGTDQTYAGGDTVDLVLNYDQSVSVETTDGTPTIDFKVGVVTRKALYVSGSGSDALTFRYTVVQGLPRVVVGLLRFLGYLASPPGDEDGDGIRVPVGNVALNGGVIKDSDNREANVPHPTLPAQSGHRVDGVQPLVGLDRGAFLDGDSIRVTYSETLDAAALNPVGFEVLVDGVERGVSEAAVDGADVTLTLSSPVVEGDEVVLGYKPDVVPVRDRAGNAVFEESVELQFTDPGGGDPGGGEDDGGGGSGGTGGGGGTAVAPRAAFTQDAECDAEGLCWARTESPVSFTDTSVGDVGLRTWDFGDGTRSRSREADHAWMEPGFYKVTLNVRNGSEESTRDRMFLVEAADPAGTCRPDRETVCLQDSRYAVQAKWWTAAGARGEGSVVHAGTNDSGLLWFFNRDNWEMVIKVLDGCSVNGHVWVFGASTTDLGYSIRVTDTVTGAVQEYRNEPGLPASGIADSTAFPGSCRPE